VMIAGEKARFTEGSTEEVTLSPWPFTADIPAEKKKRKFGINLK